jgi:WD repeat-containing protein 22
MYFVQPACSFAGPNDEYVMSGSDDFNLYVWNVNDADLEGRHQWVDKNHMVLYGHRSIVNQVRFNPQRYVFCRIFLHCLNNFVICIRCLLASSGVEKIIKVN